MFGIAIRSISRRFFFIGHLAVLIDQKRVRFTELFFVFVFPYLVFSVFSTRYSLATLEVTSMCIREHLSFRFMKDFFAEITFA